MNEKVLKTLEYNKIIDRLTEHATSDPGRRLCRELVPMDRLSDIESAQQETADALTRLFQKGSISFGSTRELGMSLRSLEIGSTLSIPELLHIASLLENVGAGKEFRQEGPGGRAGRFPDAAVFFAGAADAAVQGDLPVHRFRGGDQRRRQSGPEACQTQHGRDRGADPFPVKQHGERLPAFLSAGCAGHHQERALLPACKGGVPQPGAGHDPRPVLHGKHHFHRTLDRVLSE